MNELNDTPQSPHQPEIPSAPASEAAYLGALLAGHIDTPFLDADEFRQERHQIIYERAARRLMQGEPFAPSLLVEELSDAGELGICGGTGYLELLASQGQGVTLEVADEHARLIRQKSVAYRLMQLGELMMTPGADIGKAIANLAAEADALKSRLSISRVNKLTDAATLRARFGAQQWLWDGYLPVGHVTCLVAQQGQGKSNVALDFCHRLILGHHFPGGAEAGFHFDAADRVLYVDAEGFLSGLLARLQAWGTPDAPFIWPDGCDEMRWELNTSRGWAVLESLVAQFRPRLVVIDSLSGANSLEERDNDQMKTVMLNLVDLAKKFALVLVLIHHLRKAAVGEASYPIDLDRARGASTITQFSRVVLAIGTPDRAEPTQRRLDVIKCNLGPMAPPLGLEITESGLLWGEAPKPPEAVNPIEAARKFLLVELQGQGARLASDLLLEANDRGIKERTLYRAATDLGVRRTSEPGPNGRKFWSLGEAKPGENYPMGVAA